MAPLSRRELLPLIRAALREDRARQDVTSRRLLPPSLRLRARIVARAPGVAAGVEAAALTFTALDASLRCRPAVRSGARLSRGRTILTVEGRARSILAAERTALNLLGHLCGIATLTRAYVRRVRGTRARVLDTRKTLPGLRALEKHAVRAGGGYNHREHLSAAVLIKTNHLKALGGPGAIGRAVRRARAARPRRWIEVEVRTMAELREALAVRPDAILLDNWPVSALRRAVAVREAHPRGRRCALEASGGVTLASVGRIARTGVERISIGRLTHSAPSLDVALAVR
jgi:nicotinate-nucleotide pyrophosphorylase (carboxylating)